MSDRVIDPTRQGIASHEPEPDLIGQAKPISLEEAIATVDGWSPGFAPFGLHQLARALRRGLAEQAETIAYIGEASWMARAHAAEAMLAATVDEDAARLDNLRRENDALRRELTDLQRTFDLRWDADMRAIKRWQAAYPGNDLVWPDHADMVVWLLGRRDVIPEARDAIHGLQAAHERARAAIPCSAGLGDCHAPYYRHQPCCNLRVALWPGEEFPTDYLPDEGWIHLFEPGRGEKPRASAGCVRLVEPTELGWLDAVTEHEDVPQSIREAGNRPMHGGPVV